MYALVMGSSGDIGASSAKKLAQKGWSLYLHYNQNRERIEKLRTELRFRVRQFRIQRSAGNREKPSGGRNRKSPAGWWSLCAGGDYS